MCALVTVLAIGMVFSNDEIDEQQALRSAEEEGNDQFIFWIIRRRQSTNTVSCKLFLFYFSYGE